MRLVELFVTALLCTSVRAFLGSRSGSPLILDPCPAAGAPCISNFKMADKLNYQDIAMCYFTTPGVCRSLNSNGADWVALGHSHGLSWYSVNSATGALSEVWGLDTECIALFPVGVVGGHLIAVNGGHKTCQCSGAVTNCRAAGLEVSVNGTVVGTYPLIEALTDAQMPFYPTTTLQVAWSLTNNSQPKYACCTNATSPYNYLNPIGGCPGRSSVVNGPALNGKAALVYRGNCFFTPKWDNIYAAQPNVSAVVQILGNGQSLLAVNLFAADLTVPFLTITNASASSWLSYVEDGSSTVTVRFGKGVYTNIFDPEFGFSNYTFAGDAPFGLVWANITSGSWGNTTQFFENCDGAWLESSRGGTRHYLYVLMNKNGRPAMTVIDVSNPRAPVLVPSALPMDRFWGLADYHWFTSAGRTYLVGVAMPSSFSLELANVFVLDVTDLNNVTTQYIIPFPQRLTDAMAVSGTTLYALNGTTGVDIYTLTPTTPTRVGSISGLNATSVYHLDVVGSHLLVVRHQLGVISYDISTPTSPVAEGNLSTISPSLQSQGDLFGVMSACDWVGGTAGSNMYFWNLVPTTSADYAQGEVWSVTTMDPALTTSTTTSTATSTRSTTATVTTGMGSGSSTTATLAGSSGQATTTIATSISTTGSNGAVAMLASMATIIVTVILTGM